MNILKSTKNLFINQQPTGVMSLLESPLSLNNAINYQQTCIKLYNQIKQNVSIPPFESSSKIQSLLPLISSEQALNVENIVKNNHINSIKSVDSQLVFMSALEKIFIDSVMGDVQDISCWILLYLIDLSSQLCSQAVVNMLLSKWYKYYRHVGNSQKLKWTAYVSNMMMGIEKSEIYKKIEKLMTKTHTQEIEKKQQIDSKPQWKNMLYKLLLIFSSINPYLVCQYFKQIALPEFQLNFNKHPASKIPIIINQIRQFPFQKVKMNEVNLLFRIFDNPPSSSSDLSSNRQFIFPNHRASEQLVIKADKLKVIEQLSDYNYIVCFGNSLSQQLIKKCSNGLKKSLILVMESWEEIEELIVYNQCIKNYVICKGQRYEQLKHLLGYDQLKEIFAINLKLPNPHPKIRRINELQIIKILLNLENDNLNHDKNPDMPSFSLIRENVSQLNAHRYNLSWILQPHDYAQSKADFLYLASDFKEVKQEISEREALDKIKAIFESSELKGNELVKAYTENSFFHKIINKSLRNFTNPLYLAYFRFPIHRLYYQIKELYRQQKDEDIRCKGFSCYRGCFLKNQQLQNLKNNIGHYIQLEGFISTSLCLQIAENFESTTLITIRVPPTNNDTQLLSSFAKIKQISQFSGEEQVLFNPMNYFKIIEVKTINNRTMIELEYHLISTILEKHVLDPKNLEEFQLSLVLNFLNQKQVQSYIFHQGNLMQHLQFSSEALQWYRTYYQRMAKKMEKLNENSIEKKIFDKIKETKIIRKKLKKFGSFIYEQKTKIQDLRTLLRCLIWETQEWAKDSIYSAKLQQVFWLMPSKISQKLNALQLQLFLIESVCAMQLQFKVQENSNSVKIYRLKLTIAKEAMMLGHLQEAEKMFRNLQIEYNREPQNFNLFHKGELLWFLGYCLLEQERQQESLKLIKQAKKILVGLPKSTLTIPLLHNIDEILKKLEGSPEQKYEALINNVKEYEKIYGKNHSNVAAMYIQVAMHQFTLNKKKSLQTYQKVIDILMPIKTQQIFLVISTHLQIGILHKQFKQYEKAIDALKEAAELIESTKQRDPKFFLQLIDPMYCDILYEIANIYYLTSSITNALEHIEHCHKICQQYKIEPDPQLVFDIHQKYFQICIGVNDFKLALHHCQKCLQILESKKQQQLDKHSQTYYSLGHIYCQLSLMEEAQECFQISFNDYLIFEKITLEYIVEIRGKKGCGFDLLFNFKGMDCEEKSKEIIEKYYEFIGGKCKVTFL